MAPRTSLPGLIAAVAVLLPVAGCSKDERISALEQRVEKLEGEVRTLKSAGAPPSASVTPAPDPKAVCAKAKVAAHDAWESAEAGPKKQVRQAQAAVSAQGDCSPSHANNGCYDWHVVVEPLKKKVGAANARLAVVVAAKKASSSGALKLRDAARAVKDDPDDPAIEAAKKASEAAFEACKTVDP